MIRYLEPVHTGCLLELCRQDPIAGPRMQTTFAVYGADSMLADFWLVEQQEVAVGALMRFDGRMTLLDAGLSTDIDELVEFLQMIGGFNELEGPQPLVECIDFPGNTQSAVVMVQHESLSNAHSSQEICCDPSLEPIFRLLQEAGEGFAPNWEAWYPYVSYLMRHNLGFAAVISREGNPVCTGGVYATSGAHGLIGAVATLPAYRRRGFASELVGDLCRRCREWGLMPALLCTSSLVEFYRRLGFAKKGDWVRLKVDQS